MIELPKYNTIQAAKIKKIFYFTDGSATVTPYGDGGPFRTQPGWQKRFKGNSEDPGYYVRYEDGYESWLPSEAFEEGYTRLVPGRITAERLEEILKGLVHYSMSEIEFRHLTTRERALFRYEWEFNELLRWAGIDRPSLKPLPIKTIKDLIDEGKRMPPVVREAGSSGFKPAELTQKPGLRRMVSYWSHGSPDGKYKSEDRAACITGIYPDSTDVDLCVLNPTGFFFNRAVPFSEEPKPGHWSWPPRT